MPLGRPLVVTGVGEVGVGAVAGTRAAVEHLRDRLLVEQLLDGVVHGLILDL